MTKALGILAKIAVVVGVNSLIALWLQFFLHSSSPERAWLEPYLRLYVFSWLMIGLALSIAVLSINRSNIRRVSLNLCVILISFFVALCLGEPPPVGKMDSRYTRTEAMLVWGISGVLLGYLCTLAKDILALTFAGWSRPQRQTVVKNAVGLSSGEAFMNKRPTLWLVIGWMSVVAVATAPTAAAEPSSEKPIDIGLQKQLLVDDHVISKRENLKRKLGKVEKVNGGRPLSFTRVTKDGRRVPIDVWPLFTSVYYDAGRRKFRMWHRISFNDTSRRKEGGDRNANAIGVGVDYHRGYSESSDGLRFELVSPLQGLTSGGDTNLVVTIDEHESDPAHRYKIGYDSKSEVNAATLAHSADGIHCTPYNNGKPVTYRAADFTNQVIWDPGAKVYRLFTRTDFGWGGGPFAGRVDVKVGDKPLEVRGVRSMINPDIKADPTGWRLERHWLLDGEVQLTENRPPIEELLKKPGYVQRVRQQAMRRQIYLMTDWIYQGVHFGLMSVLEWPTDLSEGTKTDHYTRHERSIENFYIATSRDGQGWNFHWVYAGEPLVPRGPAGAWDKDMIFPASQIITHQDKHWIYYGGNNERHSVAEKNIWLARQGGIGLAWLRLDGFVALAADNQPGAVTTKAFKLEGKHVELNVDAGDGKVRVEVLDGAGRPIPGYSGNYARVFENADQLRLKAAWSGAADLSALRGQFVRLKIHLHNARLYSFQIRP